MTDIGQKALDSLKKTVRDTLEKKRRLGQYAVIWQDGKVVRLFEDEEENRGGNTREGLKL